MVTFLLIYLATEYEKLSICTFSLKYMVTVISGVGGGGPLPVLGYHVNMLLRNYGENKGNLSFDSLCLRRKI
jgi:hypothetical protein